MPYDFPTGPANGQTVTGSTGVSYRFDGTKWTATGSSGVSSFNTRVGAVTLTSGDVTATSVLAPYALTASLPAASSTLPVMDGTATIGALTTYAKADHVHPVDTSRYAATNPSGYQTAANVTTALAPYALTAGITNGSNAAAGQIGEVIALSATATAITNGAFVSLGSIALTAGDWDLSGHVTYVGAGGASIVNCAFGPSSVNNGMGTYDPCYQNYPAAANATMAFPLISQRVNVTGATTIYLIANAGFAAGTATAAGKLMARRRR